jgi:hypothetical protein
MDEACIDSHNIISQDPVVQISHIPLARMLARVNDQMISTSEFQPHKYQY